MHGSGGFVIFFYLPCQSGFSGVWLESERTNIKGNDENIVQHSFSVPSNKIDQIKRVITDYNEPILSRNSVVRKQKKESRL